MTTPEQIRQFLDTLNEDEKRELLKQLRRVVPIHPIESKLGVEAEIILEAIDRSSDLTQRGVRGVIAEAVLDLHVIRNLQGWESTPVLDGSAYDYLLSDSIGKVRIQVKMQRLKLHVPMTANQAYRYLPSSMYVVETQRTRGGKDRTGADTRPYRFGDFDILAVSMQPSTHNWDSFMYTVANWLLPRPENQKLLLKFQPVAMTPNDKWTDHLESCINWLRSRVKKRILDLPM